MNISGIVTGMAHSQRDACVEENGTFGGTSAAKSFAL